MTIEIMKPVPDSEIEHFIKSLKEICLGFKEAAQSLAKLVDRDPNVYDRILAAEPALSEEYLYRLEMTGRGRLNEKFIGIGNQKIRLIMRLLPGIQNEVAEKPVKLLISDGAKTESLEIDIINATASQLNQLITSDGRLRSEAEQRTYLESKRAKINLRVRSPRSPVEIIRGELVVHEPETRLTAAELLRYAAKIAEGK